MSFSTTFLPILGLGAGGFVCWLFWLLTRLVTQFLRGIKWIK